MDTYPTNNYLRPADLRQRWGFHAESIRRMVRQGRLPAIRIGKRLLVATSDVEAFELKNRTEAKEVA
jgi:excisionase family DNA binding protein